MKLKYELTIDDKIAFQLFLTKRSPYIRGRYIRVRCLAGLITFCILLVVTIGKSDALRLTIATFGGLLEILIAPYITKLRIGSAVRKMSDESKNNDPPAGIQNLEITGEGLAYRSDTGTGIMNWTAITGIERTSELFCLMLSTTSGIAICPDHIIEGDLDAFVAEVQRKLDAAKTEQAAV